MDREHEHCAGCRGAQLFGEKRTSLFWSLNPKGFSLDVYGASRDLDDIDRGIAQGARRRFYELFCRPCTCLLRFLDAAEGSIRFSAAPP